MDVPRTTLCVSTLGSAERLGLCDFLIRTPKPWCRKGVKDLGGTNVRISQGNHVIRTTRAGRTCAVVKVGALTLGGALATIAVIAGAVMAACFAFAMASAALLRSPLQRLSSATQAESEPAARNPAVGVAPSVSTYSSTA